MNKEERKVNDEQRRKKGEWNVESISLTVFDKTKD
jgi:hypothetical protein